MQQHHSQCEEKGFGSCMTLLPDLLNGSLISVWLYLGVDDATRLFSLSWLCLAAAGCCRRAVVAPRFISQLQSFNREEGADGVTEDSEPVSTVPLTPHSWRTRVFIDVSRHATIDPQPPFFRMLKMLVSGRCI